MNCLKRIALVLALTLVAGIVFSAQADPANPANKDAAILLEEAIYIEETLGDFDGAARIYQQIADNAESGRAAAAQALYRLGRYHEARGRRAEANAAFASLAKQYPEQKELILRVPGLADTPRDLPKFLPAPWEDGEILTYSTGNSSGVIPANTTQSSRVLRVAESGLKNGKKTWKFRSISPDGNYVTSRNILTDDMFVPIELWSQNWTQGDNRIEYLPGRAVVSRDIATGTFASTGESFTLPGGEAPAFVYITSTWETAEAVKYTFNKMVEEFILTEAAYDSEQIIYLLRCMPLQTGYETILPIFNNSRGSLSNQRISVEGRESIVTPAGTFNAWKVAYGNKGSELFYWISDDSYRYPVKFSESRTGEGVFELVSISGTGNNKPVEYSDQDISFSSPSGWFPVTQINPISRNGERWKLINFDAPEIEASCGFTLVEYPLEEDTDLNLSKNVDFILDFNKARGLQERSGSRAEITVSGVPGVRFIMDGKSSVRDEDMVLYTYVLKAGNKTLRAYFRSAKEDFDRFRPVFDSIVESVQLK